MPVLQQGGKLFNFVHLSPEGNTAENNFILPVINVANKQNRHKKRQHLLPFLWMKTCYFTANPITLPSKVETQSRFPDTVRDDLTGVPSCILCKIFPVLLSATFRLPQNRTESQHRAVLIHSEYDFLLSNAH